MAKIVRKIFVPPKHNYPFVSSKRNPPFVPLKRNPPLNKTSVIIPCYNQAQWLSEAIESVLNQTYKNFEIIVINDGSSDNTSEVARSFPVKLIEQSNRGVSIARNLGIREATGLFILPLDADDKIRNDFLEQTVDQGDIVATWYEEFGNSNTQFCPSPEYTTVEDFKICNRINSSSLYKKEVWERIGGYDESEIMLLGYEDWDFWVRAVMAGYKINIIKEKLFYYRTHGPSRNAIAIANYEKLVQYIRSK
jgi:glycosyltransferase involved in cell wall biosynthesis